MPHTASNVISELLTDEPHLQDFLLDLIEHDMPRGEGRNRMKRAVQQFRHGAHPVAA